MAQELKVFSFAITTEGWAFTTIANATGLYVGGSGNPAGSLQIGNLGRNKIDQSSYWEWTGTFEDLGVPSGSTISGYSSSALYHSCTVFNVVDVLTSGAFTINDGVLRTLVAGSSLSATTTFATATQAGSVAGLSLPSTTPITLRIMSDSVLANNAAAETTVLLDNVTIGVDYTAVAGGFKPAWATNVSKLIGGGLV